MLVVTGQRKIGIGLIANDEIYEDGPGGNDLAVSLQSHGGRVTALWKIRGHDAAVSKGRIERSVQVVADQFEIAEKRKERKGAARDHDFAVRLYHYRGGYRRQPGEICSHFATRAKAVVERPIRVVAGNDKVFPREVIVFIGLSDDDQLAISLDCHRLGNVGAAVNIGHHHAAGSERRIEVSSRSLRHLRTVEPGQHDRGANGSATKN